MASSPFPSLRSDRSALDLPVAALAGLAVAFAAFTIPGDLLAELIGVSGLPELLPAAQPPLGTTARIALAVGGSLTVFGLAFLLLRWLDRFAVQAPARRKPAEEESPRLRRRDLHPDAPVCRPISATREFGEPAPPLAVKRKATPLESPQPIEAPRQAARPLPIAGPESLPDLMARLERGLTRRQNPAEPEAIPFPNLPDASDDRLQSAIDSLQRFTARDQ